MGFMIFQRDGVLYSESTKINCNRYKSNILIEDFDDDGVVDIIVSCGDILTIVSTDEISLVKYETLSGAIGDAIVDIALANSDDGGGVAKDVYAVTDDGEMWRWKATSGNLTMIDLERRPTSVVTLIGQGGGDLLAYGTEEGFVRFVGDPDFEFTNVSFCNQLFLFVCGKAQTKECFSCWDNFQFQKVLQRDKTLY